MKAMILAAGFGTRLRPLTDIKPKALIPVANRPVIGRIIGYLKQHGVREIVVNAHHHYEQVVDYLDGGRPFGLDIHVLIEPEILGTGGGIRNAREFWDREPFVVINSDVLSEIDLSAAYREHKKAGGLATLVLHDCEPFNQIAVDDGLNITDISERTIPGRLAFTGIHILHRDLLAYIPEGGYSNIVQCYRRLIDLQEYPRAMITGGYYWRDIGTVDSYFMANREFLMDRAFLVGKGCRVGPRVRWDEWGVIGDRCLVEKNVEIRRSILWEGVTVRAGRRIVDSIVTSFKEVEKDVVGEIY